MAAARTVTLLVPNAALSSILASTLAGVPSLRVRPFESALALRTYLRLAPAALVIIDRDGAETEHDRLAASLRRDGQLAAPTPQIVALTSTLPETRTVRAGGPFDEIIVKPMSPKYLVERVLARLARPVPSLAPRLRRRDWSAYGDNIVPLFTAPAPPA
jgi:two-component system phosphate regulon response regulator PhoB